MFFKHFFSSLFARYNIGLEVDWLVFPGVILFLDALFFGGRFHTNQTPFGWPLWMGFLWLSWNLGTGWQDKNPFPVQFSCLKISWAATSLVYMLVKDGLLSETGERPEKRAPGWLGYIGDEILPRYIGIIISQYKDPYKSTSIMECHKGFERCSGDMFGEWTHRTFVLVFCGFILKTLFNQYLGGGNWHISYFHFDVRIFFKWVGKIHQLDVNFG